MGRAARTKRERRAADAAQRRRAEHFAAKVARSTPARARAAETAPFGPSTEPPDFSSPPAAKGTWGGPRPGSGRPRIYATNALRQAAYRARPSLLRSQAHDGIFL